jgi:hypothetical protein
MGPLLDNMGLFHAVISGAGKICINFTSCREMLPDPGFYRQCLDESLDELVSAALKRRTRKSRSRPGRARARTGASGNTVGGRKTGRAAAKTAAAKVKKAAKAKPEKLKPAKGKSAKGKSTSGKSVKPAPARPRSKTGGTNRAPNSARR